MIRRSAFGPAAPGTVLVSISGSVAMKSNRVALARTTLLGGLVLFLLATSTLTGQGEERAPVGKKVEVGGDVLLAQPKGPAAAVPMDNGGERPKVQREPGTLEVRFTDDSTVFLKIKEPKLELVTPYGVLFIPVNDIEKIEVGMRIPEDVMKRIEAAANNLGSPNFRAREAASAELRALEEKAVPAARRAPTKT